MPVMSAVFMGPQVSRGPRPMERYGRTMKVALAAVTGTQGGPRTYAISLLRALVSLATGDEYTLVSEERGAASDVAGIRRVHVPVPAKAARPIVEAIALPLK